MPILDREHFHPSLDSAGTLLPNHGNITNDHPGNWKGGFDDTPTWFYFITFGSISLGIILFNWQLYALRKLNRETGWKPGEEYEPL